MRTPQGVTDDIEARRSARKRWLLFIAGLAIVIGVASVVGQKSLVKIVQMNSTRSELQQEIIRLKQVNENLTLEVQPLADNPGQVEAIAREDLGLVKPGEIVYQFRPSGHPAMPPSPSR
ncbi:MAG: septum formation initiator family protein [candidate division NC10 bacterium]|nr:septum formation initiator family protein [candidate division NC10 bacterium]